MKKMQVILLVALSSALLLFGCGKEQKEQKPEAEPPVTEQAKEEPEVTDIPEEKEEQPEEVETPEEEVPPEEGMVRSRITNEWVTEEVDNTRPIAVMMPNTRTAAHYGISQADVLYECNVEGSITRLMAVFQDWSDFDRLGNVRSSRDYYIYWSFEWDALYIHFGGPF